MRNSTASFRSAAKQARCGKSILVLLRLPTTLILPMVLVISKAVGMPCVASARSHPSNDLESCCAYSFRCSLPGPALYFIPSFFVHFRSCLRCCLSLRPPPPPTRRIPLSVCRFQREVAEKLFAEEKSARRLKKMATELEPVRDYYEAEEEHQQVDACHPSITIIPRSITIIPPPSLSRPWNVFTP